VLLYDGVLFSLSATCFANFISFNLITVTQDHCSSVWGGHQLAVE
jgi:hypothetical protein